MYVNGRIDVMDSSRVGETESLWSNGMPVDDDGIPSKSPLCALSFPVLSHLGFFRWDASLFSTSLSFTFILIH